MPVVSMTLTDIEQSVSRPIIYSIIREVEEVLKIDPNTDIIFPGEMEKASQPGSTANSDTRNPTFNNNNNLYVEVEEEYDPDYISTTAINQPEQPTVFFDKEVGVSIRPIYAPTSIIINFKYKTNSRNNAKRWRDDIRTKVSQMRDMNLHSIEYHYAIPVEYLMLLEAVYKNKHRLETDCGEFDEYLAKHLCSRARFAADLTNNSRRIVIGERQSEIIGIYGFDYMPDKLERDDSSGQYVASFSYKFNYDKPISGSLRYPPVVYNKLLPEKFVTFAKGNRRNPADEKPAIRSYSKEALHQFETQNEVLNNLNPAGSIHIPDFDDSGPKTAPAGYLPIFTLLCTVDETDKKSLIDLNDLGPIMMDPDILSFITSTEYSFFLKLYMSLINVSLYCNGVLQDSSLIGCGSDLNIKAVSQLDLTKYYHIQFNVLADLSMVSNQAINRMRRFIPAFLKLYAAINEVLRNNTGFAILLSNKLGSIKDFNLIFNYLVTNRSKVNLNINTLLKTVQTAYIVAYKKT